MFISNFLPTTFAVCLGNCRGGRLFGLSIKYNKEKLINKIKFFNHPAADFINITILTAGFTFSSFSFMLHVSIIAISLWLVQLVQNHDVICEIS